MNSFLFVEPDLIHVAEIVKNKIQTRFGLGNAVVEQLFDENIDYKPTFHWKTKTHIYICDIAVSPFPQSINNFYSEVAVKGLPVKVIIAYLEKKQKEILKYKKELKKAKEYGIGLISIDEDDKVTFENLGISIPLHLAELDYTLYDKKFRPEIESAYESYMTDGKPDVGLQKLGQLVEKMILTVATQAKKKGNFVYAGYTPGKYISLNKLLDNLIKENVLDIGFLGNCKTFAKDRNSVSHPPKTINEAKKIEKKLKESFQFGLRIIENMPLTFKAKKYIIKI
ncbi:MAG: hypothetical protein IM568_06265 [Flavobacterium sp.]|nr:hypothetical protein [Flavobacterium sp.]